MTDFKRLKEIIRSTKSYHREIQIEKVIGTTEGTKTGAEGFIEDIKHHLSTCINRETFRRYFKIDLEEIGNCNCHQHIEKEADFFQTLRLLYSQYKNDEWNIENYIKDEYMEMVRQP
jgi:hypothetical protein